jgi:hypothetical protein
MPFMYFFNKTQVVKGQKKYAAHFCTAYNYIY